MSESGSINRRGFLQGIGVAGLLTAVPLTSAKIVEVANAAATFTEAKRISSKNGLLNLALEVKPAMIDFEGTKRWALTYNGIYPGPTLVTKPGDTLNIALKNSWNAPTNLHTHGLHASPAGNSDNPLLMIAPGETFKYQIKIPSNQTSGTSWYHPHHHTISAGQLHAGLAGAIIVNDKYDTQPIMSSTTDRVLVFSDPRLGGDSSIIDTSMMDRMHGRSGPYLLINGQLNPKLVTPSGKAERWRVINSSPSRYLDLSVENCDIYVIGTDGGRVSGPFQVRSLIVTPGQRFEVIIKPNMSGTWRIFDGGDQIATLATNTSGSPRASSSGSFSGSSASKVLSLISLPTLPVLKATKTRTINIKGAGGTTSMGGMANHELAFTFDGKKFDPKVINQSVKLGIVEDWIINNPTSMHHPFHIHAWNFQIIDRGDGRAEPGWKDTVNVPSGSSVRIRINFADFGGTTVYHCHILDHEDGGMMGIVKVG